MAGFKMHDAGKRTMSTLGFTTGITCPHCKQAGTVLWELHGGLTRQDGSDRKLVRLSPGFHEEKGRIASGTSAIVCNACDEILLD